MAKPILCVDFDGVVHSYTTGWTSADIVSDAPVPGAIQWLWRAQQFFDVQIYSSRSSQPGGREVMERWLRAEAWKVWRGEPELLWRETPEECVTIFMTGLSFPAEKPPAFLTIDDRAICFDGNWAGLDPEGLLQFKPWNKRGSAA